VSLTDDLSQTRRDIQDHLVDKQKHPEGWEPTIRFDASSGEGEITTGAVDGCPDDWTPLLEHYGLDERYEIDGNSVQFTAWDGWKRGDQGEDAVSCVQYSYKAKVRLKQPGRDPDYDALLKEIRGHKPKKPAAGGSATMIVGLADWQLGKRDGDGTEGIVHRALLLADKLPRRVKALRAQNVQLGTLIVAGMGDLVEGCEGHYPMQSFSVELDRRQQVKVARRLLVKLLTAWAPLFERVIVPCVPGNHGENRSNGKAYTSFGDNDDVAVFEQVAEILAENDAYANVSFVIPESELTVTLDCSGTVVGFAHGHQATRGNSIPQKVEAWWKGQQHGRHPIGDADLLLTAHYHHFAAKADAGRTWLQCPTIDGGSEWFEHQSGSRTTPGTLSLVVGDGGWNHLEIL